MAKVYFVGAGPGDPELLTLKGRRLLAEAGLVIYAGSLVNPALLSYCRPQARLVDSSGLTLEEIMDLIRQGLARRETVVRLASGDPSLYGALAEQLACCRAAGLPYEVVPGVSSFLAAAAALGVEYTVPERQQSVILTRLGGRTPVPEREALEGLARHQASLCLFLSAGRLEEAVRRLAQGYPETTPAAVVYKASWPEQQVIRGSLADIVQRAAAAGLERTALLLVGEFLEPGGGGRSRLYARGFGHGYRPE